MLQFSAASYTSSKFHPQSHASGVHSAAEAHLSCHQRQGPVRIPREVQDKLAVIQAPGAYGKTISHTSSKSSINGVFHDQHPGVSSRQGDQKVSPTRIGFSTCIQELCKKWKRSPSQTGRWSEPAAHGRQDVSAYNNTMLRIDLHKTLDTPHDTRQGAIPWAWKAFGPSEKRGCRIKQKTHNATASLAFYIS